MTPSLNFHTKMMYSLHAMLYMVYGGYDATLEGKISDFEWSVRLIVDGITVMLLWLTAQFVKALITGCSYSSSDCSFKIELFDMNTLKWSDGPDFPFGSK